MTKTVPISRRTILLAAGATAITATPPPARLVTLTDWLNADPKARAAGLKSCLAHIRATDELLQAWVHVQPRKQAGRGKLSGIPFGLKDIIETRGLATEYGSPIYKGRIGSTDAAIVQDLCARGAILLGKTQTAAFAMRDPPPTRNPRNPEHTPGGSSSGSAAAVAAGMVPFAIGTQTSGSTLKPASFCGVTGFKATFGLLSLDGVLPYAKSLDTLGFFTHSPADMLLLWDAMGHSIGRDEELEFGVPEPMPQVEPAMTSAFQNAVSSLRRAGVPCRPVDIATMLTKLAGAQRVVGYYEGARFHQSRFTEFGDRLGHTGRLVREGLQMTEANYDDARQFIAASRVRMAELYKATPVILVPAATGPAPKGLASTGDSGINTPWTALGTPAISVPMPVGAALPLGLQLTAAPGDDARVLRAATRLHRILNAI